LDPFIVGQRDADDEPQGIVCGDIATDLASVFVDHAQPTFADMLSAGATTLQITEACEWTTRVLQDPAGNEFCLIGPD